MKKQLIIGGAVLVVLVGLFGLWRERHDIEQDIAQRDVPEAVTFEEVSGDTSEDVVEEVAEEDVELEPEEAVAEEESEPVVAPEPDASEPGAINLAVPFTSQAPHSNWDMPYQEACEEASVLMAVAFVAPGSVDLSTPDAADEEIVALVNLGENELALPVDTTAEETVRIAQVAYPNVTFDLLYSPTIAQLKEVLAEGKPVIVPAAGRELGNPNFSGAGPLYHMLLLRGYTDRYFVTNDPGTRNGEGYLYTHQVLMDAIGDWNDGDPANGQKVVIVVSAA